jgi:hypothetical protein
LVALPIAAVEGSIFPNVATDELVVLDVLASLLAAFVSLELLLEADLDFFRSSVIVLSKKG